MASAENRETVRALTSGVDDALASRLLEGALDLHVHSGPSTMARQVDHFQAVEEAAAAGMRGILFKDHHYSVAPFIPLMERVLGHLNVAMYGGLVLNNTTGGLNPFVVDAQLKQGAKLIWMPTAQSANHIRSSHRKQRLASNVQLKPSPGITVVDGYGEIVDEGAGLQHFLARQFPTAGHFPQYVGAFRIDELRGNQSIRTDQRFRRV